MPWIERRPGGYVVRWRDGGRQSPSQCTPLIERKDDATRRSREIATELNARQPVRGGIDLPLAEILTRWKTMRLSRGARDFHVAASVVRMTNMIRSHGWTTCRDVTPAKVEAWRQAGGSPRTGAMLRATMRWAMETLGQTVDARTLIALRPRPKGRRPKADLPTADAFATWQRLADAASPSAGALVHCLATYGWRPITAADLTVGDLDLAAGLITTSVKGGDVVRHPLLPATLDRLRPLVAGRPASAPLFLDPTTGRAWEPHAARLHSIVRWCKSCLGMNSYDLKRLAISSMLARKIEPQTVALFTGHRTISQVLTYARTNEERAREALASLSSPVGTSGHGAAAVRR